MGLRMTHHASLSPRVEKLVVVCAITQLIYRSICLIYICLMVAINISPILTEKIENPSAPHTNCICPNQQNSIKFKHLIYRNRSNDRNSDN